MARVHTFVFADLAGFTALTEAHGDHAAADLVGDFAAKVDSWLPEFGGGDAKTIGDALMLRLDSAPDAVELGLAIVERTADTPRFPEVRVGMNSGTAVSRDGDWFGRAVNVAARVAGQAQGCEVLLSANTYEAASHLETVRFDDAGTKRLRNVSAPLQIYRANRLEGGRPDLHVDPVCRMALRPDQPGPVVVHDYVEFWFCSKRCARAFEKEPRRYLRDSGDEEGITR